MAIMETIMIEEGLVVLHVGLGLALVITLQTTLRQTTPIKKKAQKELTARTMTTQDKMEGLVMMVELRAALMSVKRAERDRKPKTLVKIRPTTRTSNSCRTWAAEQAITSRKVCSHLVFSAKRISKKSKNNRRNRPEIRLCANNSRQGLTNREARREVKVKIMTTATVMERERERVPRVTHKGKKEVAKMDRLMLETTQQPKITSRSLPAHRYPSIVTIRVRNSSISLSSEE